MLDVIAHKKVLGVFVGENVSSVFIIDILEVPEAFQLELDVILPFTVLSCHTWFIYKR